MSAMSSWQDGGSFDLGHPFRWRTWARGWLPWFVIDLGIAAKGMDCEQFGAWHRWYNVDDENSGCYHCRVIRPGQWWTDARRSSRP